MPQFKAPAQNVLSQLSAPVRFLRSVNYRARQRDGLLPLGSVVLGPLLAALATLVVVWLIDYLLTPAVFGPLGDPVADGPLAIYGAILGFIGVATLASAVSLTLVQSTTERYYSRIAKHLVEDRERDRLLAVIFYAFVVTLGSVSLAVFGVLHPLVGLPVPIILTTLIYVLLFGYVVDRINLFDPARLAGYVARRSDRFRTAAIVDTGSAGTRAQRSVCEDLCALAELAKDPSTPHEAVGGMYDAMRHLVRRHAQERRQRCGGTLTPAYRLAPVSARRLAAWRGELWQAAIERIEPGSRRAAPACPGNPHDLDALWFESLMAQLLVASLISRRAESEFRHAWAECVGRVLDTAREERDYALALVMLRMLNRESVDRRSRGQPRLRSALRSMSRNRGRDELAAAARSLAEQLLVKPQPPRAAQR